MPFKEIIFQNFMTLYLDEKFFIVARLNFVNMIWKNCVNDVNPSSLKFINLVSIAPIFICIAQIFTPP